MEFNVIQSLLLAINGDASAYVDLMDYIKKGYITLKDQSFLRKCESFINGVYGVSKNNLFVENLFEDDKKKNSNALRIMDYLEKTDSLSCVDFMINATRSFAMKNINAEMYYRIMKAISETLYEDLCFVRDNITTGKYYKGNCQILALARSGLMIVAGMDGDAGVEEQIYVFTSLGHYVDRYALSLANDYRQRWYNDYDKNVNPLLYDVKLGERHTVQSEDINQLFPN